MVLRSYPGEWASIAARIYVTRRADGSVIEGLNLDGRNSNKLPSPTIDASRVILRGNEITNGHTAICVDLGQHGFGRANRVQILGNRIHNCGVLPARNHDHGIYVDWADRTVIKRNWIYENADRGIQLYPQARRTLVTGNVIAGNGEGIIFGGDVRHASSRNVVRNNVIADSKLRFNVESSWGGAAGRHNRAISNCLWTTREGYFGGRPAGSGMLDHRTGFRAGHNLVADPGFANPASGDFRINTASPCAALLAAGR